MAQNSKIEWTHHTFNPLWGCMKVSEGCKNCYAETLSHRYGYDIWGAGTRRRAFGEKHWLEPVKWNKEAEKLGERRRVFCGSMCDIFEEHFDWNEPRPQLFNLIEKTPYLDWLLLTKRPENIVRMVPESWLDIPQENVWYGTSVENEKVASSRISHLLSVPATIRFLSCEPLLEKVSIEDYLNIPMEDSQIHWVIVGGESGHGKRPFNADWARLIRNECQDNKVAFFMKQMDKIQPIPDDLMIREFPETLIHN